VPRTPVLHPMSPVGLSEGLAREIRRMLLSMPEEMVLGFLMTVFTRDTLRDMRNDLELWQTAGDAVAGSSRLLSAKVHTTTTG
jgi:fatty acid/phospholipid biosynthesis enzyme